jgi:hypothetical protein
MKRKALSEIDDLHIENTEHKVEDKLSMVHDCQAKTDFPQEVRYDLCSTGSNIHISDDDNRQDETKESKIIVWSKCILRKLRSVVDVSLLKNPLFVAYGVFLSIGMSTCASLYNACIAGMVQERGFTREQMALLLSLSGAIGGLAKIVAGFVFDLRVVRPFRVHVFVAGCAIIATSILSVPLISGTTALYTVWLTYSIVTSFIGSQGSVVMVDLVGLKKHANGLGLSMPFRGIGILMGPPLGGRYY